MIPRRSVLLAICLSATVVVMVVKTYLLWRDGQWDLPARSQAGGPQPPKVSSPTEASQTGAPAAPPRMAATDPSTRAPALAEGSRSGFPPTGVVEGATGLPVGLHFIISKNIFDPERGATQTKETEANVRAMQRLRGLVLLGTAIIGESRYAIVQESNTQAGGRPPQGQGSQTMRFKTGDTFEGFSLSQIQDKNVVFTNGASRVELALDYFRKVETAAPQVASAPRPQAAAAPSPGAIAPRVVPQPPRRERLPQPPTS